MRERFHKGRYRPDTHLSLQLKDEALGLIPGMMEIFQDNGIGDATVRLCGSLQAGLADKKSDFDYLFDRRNHSLDGLIQLIAVVQDQVCPSIQRQTHHRIEAHFPMTPIFQQAFRESDRMRMRFFT